MGWSCVICTDLFDNVKTISTAPCGHLFHFDCLKQWIAQSKTCPECRQTVTLSRIVKLFPNINNAASPGLNSSSLENELHSVKTELSEKQQELKKLREKNDHLTLYAAKAESESCDHLQKSYDMGLQIQDLKLKLRSVKKLESRIHELELINLHLNAENEHLKDIQIIVNGTQNEVEQLLTNTVSKGDSRNCMRELASFCSILKREFDRVAHEKSELKLEIKKLNNTFGPNGSSYKKLLEINKLLKRRVSHFEKDTSAGQTFSTHLSSVNIKKPHLQPESGNGIDAVSPISVKFMGNQRKIDVVVLDNPKPAFSSTIDCNDTVQVKDLPRHIHQEDSVTRTGYDGLGGHSSVVMKTNPKMIQRIKLPKRNTKPLTMPNRNVMSSFYEK